MPNNPESGFYNPRVFLAFILCSAGALLAMFSFAADPPSGTASAANTPLVPAAAVVPLLLHFHGNPTDDSPCTGSGSADIAACGGAKLLTRATLGTGPAAHWDPPTPALDGTAAQNI